MMIVKGGGVDHRSIGGGGEVMAGKHVGIVVVEEDFVAGVKVMRERGALWKGVWILVEHSCTKDRVLERENPILLNKV